MELSLVPWYCQLQRLSGAGWRNNMHCTSQKIIEGMEPGEMLPLTLRNRDEDNMCGAE
jgi:hypothetical protein